MGGGSGVLVVAGRFGYVVSYSDSGLKTNFNRIYFIFLANSTGITPYYRADRKRGVGAEIRTWVGAGPFNLDQVGS